MTSPTRVDPAELMPVDFTRSTRLASPAAELWGAISRMDRINDELRPYLKMTAPAAARQKTIEDVPLGRDAFTSVILLFGIVPIDLHVVRVVERRSGVGFVECSRTLFNAVWRHQRTIEPSSAGAGCTLTDRISFRSRVPGLDRCIAPLVRALFVHRHRRLFARFGAA